MLHILGCLLEENDLWVHLAKFVDLDVSHSHVIVHHLLARLIDILPAQHVIVRSLVVHALFNKSN